MNDLRKQIKKPKCTVGTVKDSMRKQFRDRIRQLRFESLLNVRKITEHLDSNIQLLKNNLYIEASGLTSIEIMNILEEVEEEIKLEALMNEAVKYEQDSNEIIEELLKNVNFCPICDKIMNQNLTNTICEQCCESFDDL